MKFTKDTFYVQHLAFQPIGLKLEPERFKNFYALWIPSIGCFITCVSIMRRGFENLDSVDEFSEIVAPGIQCLIAMWKGIIFAQKHETLAKFVTKLRSYIDQANKEEEQILISENNHDKYLSGFFYIMGAFAGSASLVAPCFVMAVVYITTGNFALLLPYKGNFILDPAKFYNYCAIYTFSFMSTFFVVNCTLVVDSLFSWYCHNIAAQFRILHLKLKQANIKYGKNGDALEAEVIRCIKHHQEIITIAEELSHMYESIAFVQYSLCSIQLCLIAYQIIHGVAVSQMPFLSTFLVAVCMQMSVYSYNGDRLKTEGEEFASGIYEAISWDNNFLKPRKLLMVAMCRAQKPVILSGIFFDVNWNLFVEVMKTAFSYVTLMRTLGQE